MSRIIIVGAGAAGLFAACNISRNNEVIVIEKNDRPGRKLAITGKGRCNITNASSIDGFMKKVLGNGKFLYSAFNACSNLDVIEFFEKNGVKTKVERGDRVFPVSDSAKDVVNCLYDYAVKKCGVKFKFNLSVKEILEDNGKVFGVKLSNGEIIEADSVILATGGKSYPATGSTGDGYSMASKVGHTIVTPRPSLVGLKIDEDFLNNLQGLSLKNVQFSLKDEKGKKIYSEFGEMLFTHFGVSGPIVLSGSRYLHKFMDDKLNVTGVTASIDFKPALSFEKLDTRVLRDFEKYSNKQFKNALFDLLPEKLISVIIKRSGIDESKVVNEITKEERLKLVNILKDFSFEITGLRGIDEAIVTAGGIKVSEINPSTMESKFVSGLYFIGEIIDVDAVTGGYNLQIAFSTAYLASKNFE